MGILIERAKIIFAVMIPQRGGSAIPVERLRIILRHAAYAVVVDRAQIGHRVAVAVLRGRGVPVDGVRHVLRNLRSLLIFERDRAHRFHIAALSALDVPGHGRADVGGDALTQLINRSDGGGRRGRAQVRGLAIKNQRLRVILRDVLPMIIMPGQVLSGRRAAAVDRFLIPIERLRFIVILRGRFEKALAHRVHRRQVILIDRLLPPIASDLPILIHAAAIGISAAEVEEGKDAAAIGRRSPPAHRFDRVLAHAAAVGVKIAQAVHRVWVAALGSA